MIKDRNGRLPYVGEPSHEGVPCCVKHPHAGGQCEEPAAMTVYGLNFCEPHGAQATEGALEEARHDAEVFFGQFRNPEARGLPVLVERAIEAASDSVFDGGGEDFYEVILRAFPNPTPEVRAMVEQAEADDEPGYESFADALIGSLQCMHRLMRTAYEERETWLLELLEGERQSVAAQCAYAVRDAPRRLEAALEASRKRRAAREEAKRREAAIRPASPSSEAGVPCV